MTTSTLTVTDFLLARIAEDEATARAACEAPWVTMDWPAASQVLIDPKAIRDEKWKYGKLGHVAMTEHAQYADHIARHDPARVLAQCAAMRKIVEDLTSERHEVVEDCWYTCAAATDEHDGGECCDDGRRGTGCDCGRDTRVNRRLGILAPIWASHPDWREEWRA